MLLTRSHTLPWKGKDYTFTPTLAAMSALAIELNQRSEGTVNTLLLAQQMLNGTADPVFIAIALRHVLGWAGVEATYDEAYSATISGSADVIYFRMRYIEAVVPSIDFGKKPEGPAPGAKKTRSGNSKKLTSRKSSSRA